MLVPNRHSSSDAYRYGFNGKEKDDEVKGEGLQYDYGFRIYDPRIGKFLSLDPLFRSFPWYTPYQFAGNKPINCVDLDGLEEVNYTVVERYSDGSALIKIEVDKTVSFNSNNGRLLVHNIDTNSRRFSFEYQELNQFFNTDADRNPNVKQFGLQGLNANGNYTLSAPSSKILDYRDQDLLQGLVKSNELLADGQNDIWSFDTAYFIVSDFVQPVEQEIDINFNKASSTFVDPILANSQLDDLVQQIGNNGSVDITVNAAFKNATTNSNYNDADTGKSSNIMDLINKRGEVIKDALIRRGVSGDRINIKAGNINNEDRKLDIKIIDPQG